MNMRDIIRIVEARSTHSIPNPSIIFHVSPKKNRKSILKKGLLLQNVEFPNIQRTPGIYGMETLEQARDWAFYFMLDKHEAIDIWKISVPNNAEIVPEPDREIQEIYDAWIIRQPIAPDLLELVYTQPIRNSTRFAPPSATKIVR